MDIWLNCSLQLKNAQIVRMVLNSFFVSSLLDYFMNWFQSDEHCSLNTIDSKSPTTIHNDFNGFLLRANS